MFALICFLYSIGIFLVEFNIIVAGVEHLASLFRRNYLNIAKCFETFLSKFHAERTRNRRVFG